MTPRQGGVGALLSGVLPDERGGERPLAGAPVDAGFNYTGGPIISNPQVYATFWGPNWNDAAHTTRRTDLVQFVQDFLASDYMNILSQYGVGAGAGKCGRWIGSSVLTTVTGQMTDGTIHSTIQGLINSHVLPEPGSPSNMALLIFLDETIEVKDSGQGIVMCEPSGDTAFGYHFFFTTSGGHKAYYSVIPALDDNCLRESCLQDASCSLHLAQTQEARQTQVASHEFSEMVTDPEISAWRDKGNGSENGDDCNGQSATITVAGRSWTVQRMYSMTDDTAGNPACVVTPAAPLPLFVSPNGPTAQGDQMQPGQALHPNQGITSVDGRFTFIYQGDGNLVLYRNLDHAPLWASNTAGRLAGVCIMQGDGNLVIYMPGTDNPVWASNTAGHPGSHLIAQSDGNVVIYQPNNAPIWATNTVEPTLPNGPTAQGDHMNVGEVLHAGNSITSSDGRFTFIYQGDGNLVLYRNFDHAPLWASNTAGHSPGVCIMQGDGNLVVYDAGAVPRWASNTAGHPGSHLIAQSDGNVVIYQPNNAPIWATNTVEPTLPNGPTAQGDHMNVGEVLHAGNSITSSDGRFTFIYQGDGNLVLYRNFDHAPLWASNTAGHSPGVCIMQGDGNLVVYDAGAVPRWASNTAGHPGSHLIAQSDGNVVIYQPNNAAIWATNTVEPTLPNGPTAQGDHMNVGEVLHAGNSITSSDGRFTFIYQGDGNLVLYRNLDHAPLWASNTAGHSPGVCIMQGDGNLVVYDAGAVPRWASNTAGHPGSHLIAQSDGNVVIYQPNNIPIWATNTAGH